MEDLDFYVDLSLCAMYSMDLPYTANFYSKITITLLWKLARNAKGICKCQVRWNVSKKYADLGQKLLRDKGSLLALQDELRNHGT